MQPISPYNGAQTLLPEEDKKHSSIMARTGDVIGFNNESEVVWRFGFMKDSEMSQAFKVSVSRFLWLLTDMQGNVKACYRGESCCLPRRFKDVIDS